MPKMTLTIITENQNKMEKAFKLGQMIKEELGLEKDPEIESYEKFENSYKLNFEIHTSNDQPSLIDMANYSNDLCSSWMLLKVEKGQYELVFHKTDQSTFEKREFNVIQWAHIHSTSNRENNA